MPNQVGTSQVIRVATFEVDLQAQDRARQGCDFGYRPL